MGFAVSLLATLIVCTAIKKGRNIVLRPFYLRRHFLGGVSQRINGSRVYFSF
jgi:hypothetical protein